MPRKTLLTAVAVAVLASGCASRPSSISAAYVPFEKYTDHACQNLNALLYDARDKLRDASDQQDSKANMDALGVFLVGIPISKLSGDHEADVARWKGEVAAIEVAQQKRGCR